MKYKAHVHDRSNKTVILWLEEVEESQLETLLTIVGKEEKDREIDSSIKVMMDELGMSPKV